MIGLNASPGGGAFLVEFKPRGFLIWAEVECGEFDYD